MTAAIIAVARDRDAERFWSYIDATAGPDQCWPFTGATSPHGYGYVRWGNGTRFAHRVAFALTHGHDPVGLVLHSCDNPPCCNPAHLREGDHVTNAADAVERDRIRRGERHHAAKLTHAQVAEIRRRHVRGAGRHRKGNTDELADEFGVSRDHITRLARGAQWARG